MAAKSRLERKSWLQVDNDSTWLVEQRKSDCDYAFGPLSQSFTRHFIEEDLERTESAVSKPLLCSTCTPRERASGSKPSTCAYIPATNSDVWNIHACKCLPTVVTQSSSSTSLLYLFVSHRAVCGCWTRFQTVCCYDMLLHRPLTYNFFLLVTNQ